MGSAVGSDPPGGALSVWQVTNYPVVCTKPGTPHRRYPHHTLQQKQVWLIFAIWWSYEVTFLSDFKKYHLNEILFYLTAGFFQLVISATFSNTNLFWRRAMQQTPACFKPQFILKFRDISLRLDRVSAADSKATALIARR